MERRGDGRGNNFSCTQSETDFNFGSQKEQHQGFMGENHWENWKSQQAARVFNLRRAVLCIQKKSATSHPDDKEEKKSTGEEGEKKQRQPLIVLHSGLPPLDNQCKKKKKSLQQTAASVSPFTKPPTPGEWEETRSCSASYLSSPVSLETVNKFTQLQLYGPRSLNPCLNPKYARWKEHAVYISRVKACLLYSGNVYLLAFLAFFALTLQHVSA